MLNMRRLASKCAGIVRHSLRSLFHSLNITHVQKFQCVTSSIALCHPGLWVGLDNRMETILLASEQLVMPYYHNNYNYSNSFESTSYFWYGDGNFERPNSGSSTLPNVTTLYLKLTCCSLRDVIAECHAEVSPYSVTSHPTNTQYCNNLTCDKIVLILGFKE